jgi:NADP-dependent aldehyde dehydrogenase
MERAPIFVGGEWIEATASACYRSVDPTTGQTFGPSFPISTWDDIEAVLETASSGEPFAPAELRAAFLEKYAELIDANASSLAAIAQQETGLPAEGRYKNTEIPRTTNQLRQAAAQARSLDYQLATIDSKLNIRSCLETIGTVLTFGPANFPFAYNALAGGDFASAIAAGNDVIARAHPSHPQTTLALAKLLEQAAKEVGLTTPPTQLLFGFSNEDGLRLARSRRIAAIGFTGSRVGGLALKASAETVGTPFFGELSSINPVVITPEALAEKHDAIVEQYLTSVLAACGQMCTNPGIVFLVDSPESTKFINAVVAKFESAPPGVLLNEGMVKGLASNVARVKDAGAAVLCGGSRVEGDSFRFQNTALRVSDAVFARNPSGFQTEMFGNACLFVVSNSMPSMMMLLKSLEGNLCGSLYLGASQSPEPEARVLSQLLREKVGRLLNDKMPTGVAVSSAMNHGGPYPATGHAHFTAVGFPASIRRFTRLNCYDNVRHELLPPVLRNDNPTRAWRFVDGQWTRDTTGAGDGK